MTNEERWFFFSEMLKYVVSNHVNFLMQRRELPSCCVLWRRKPLGTRP